MQLVELFDAAKAGSLPLTPAKAVFVTPNSTLPESRTLPDDELIDRLGEQEVELFDSVAEGYGKVFIGSTAYLAEGMQLCDTFAEFVVNVSNW